MRDAFGKVLNMGDDVIYASISGSSVYMGKFTVVGFTEKMVRVVSQAARPGTRSMNVLSKNLVLYPEAEVQKYVDNR